MNEIAIAVVSGEIQHFNFERNFGFILGDDGQRFFFHGSRVDGDLIPRKGDRCTIYGYLAAIPGKEPKATRVVIDA